MMTTPQNQSVRWRITRNEYKKLNPPFKGQYLNIFNLTFWSTAIIYWIIRSLFHIKGYALITMAADLAVILTAYYVVYNRHLNMLFPKTDSIVDYIVTLKPEGIDYTIQSTSIFIAWKDIKKITTRDNVIKITSPIRRIYIPRNAFYNENDVHALVDNIRLMKQGLMPNAPLQNNGTWPPPPQMNPSPINNIPNMENTKNPLNPTVTLGETTIGSTVIQMTTDHLTIKTAPKALMTSAFGSIIFIYFTGSLAYTGYYKHIWILMGIGIVGFIFSLLMLQPAMQMFCWKCEINKKNNQMIRGTLSLPLDELASIKIIQSSSKMFWIYLEYTNGKIEQFSKIGMFFNNNAEALRCAKIVGGFLNIPIKQE